MHMSQHAPGTKLHGGNRTHDLFATLAAKPLARLYRSTASIAEHDFLPRSFYRRRLQTTQQIDTEMKSVESKPLDYRSANQPIRFQAQNEKATRQQGDLFFFKGE